MKKDLAYRTRMIVRRTQQVMRADDAQANAQGWNERRKRIEERRRLARMAKKGPA